MTNEANDNAQTVRIGLAPKSGTGASAGSSVSSGAPTEREAVWDPFYESVGGHAAFKKLVDEFYRLVATDDVLRPMYPEGDLAPAAHRLTMFLEQYWGGPTTYQEERGHPRLRMRHAAFKIGPVARDRWISHMRSALDTLGLPPLIEAELWAYLDRAAHSLLNSFED